MCAPGRLRPREAPLAAFTPPLPAGLAAASNVWGVTAGGVLGHAVCTGAAVLGGRHLAEHINERAVATAGGLLFLIFGLHSAYSGPPE
jgi:putative Ca2+/H+ antiporter (TMEM165/GDT1 family)